MARSPKFHYSLVDSEGVVWVEGLFTPNQIQTWRNRYMKLGIYLKDGE